MSAVARNNVAVAGLPDGPPMLFAHGFGCDQAMWRSVAPAFAATHRTVLLDHVGVGGSDRAAYDPERYATLDGYAADVVDLLEELDLREVVYVGHSVSAMIGVLASIAAPERFARLVLVGPSPRYIDDAGYEGGFERRDIDELIASLDDDLPRWSSAMAPVIMGNGERPELADELEATFCRMDPEVARGFARVTFLSDNRADLPRVAVPTVVLQCADDVIAPQVVGEYVAAHVPDARLVQLEATGHCPNLSAPAETVAAIRSALDG